ncbi:MAG: hypothetical protein KDA80_21180, partial [Planctomycetaceae bacterium]|nr:hypothetical protein [Planctomycetaceae bacterium]
MAPVDDDILEFKFHWLNENGQATTMFRKKGRFDREILTLEDAEIPVAAIVQSIVRDNRMVLAVFTGDGENPVATMLIQP